MKKLFFLFVVIFLSGKLSAQVTIQQRPGAQPATPAKTLPVRQVSGIVKDSTDSPVIGAIVTLTSVADTLKASTNVDGIFVFRTVKAWEFTLSVSSLGYRTIVKKGKYNDATARLTMDPIMLKAESRVITEVVLNGTPSIVYKTDTVEYRASDYVVRAGATVDELLKKMEGMEVGNDGTLSYNGTAIGQARLNGKALYGGDMASVIQNLPAEIIEKAQIVDDYGDQARRTGIKEGDPQKVLNLTTRIDKSVGNQARLNGGGGTSDRYEGNANLTRLNGNQTITVQGSFQKTPNGIAGGNASVGRLAGGRGQGGGGGGGGGSVSGGTTTTAGPVSLSYRDNWGSKIEVNGGIQYNYQNPFELSSTTSQSFQGSTGAGGGGTTFGVRESQNERTTKSQSANFELEWSIDSANFLQIRPNVSFNTSETNNYSTNFQTGFIHQDQLSRSTGDSKTPNYGGTVGFQHIFKKPGRTFSVESTFTRGKTDNTSIQNDILNFYDLTSDAKLPDSVVHRMNTINNINSTSRSSITYSEPLSASTRFEFNSNMERRGYDNDRTQSNLDNSNVATKIDSLSNAFNYTFTQYRNSVNFRYGANNATRLNFSLGATAVNTSLVGVRETTGTKTNQDYFKLIPIARFQYRFSRQHQISLNYNGRAQEPSFDQIQPVRDVTNPQRPIVGNPDLKVAFTHSMNLQYQNYLANSKLNLSFGAGTTINEDQVTSNQVTINNIKTDANGNTYNNRVIETRYINLNGGKSNNAQYAISKAFSSRKYSLQFQGNINNSHRLAMNNNIVYPSDTWQLVNSFGPRINPTTWLEINPYASYDYNKSKYTVPGAIDVETKRYALSLDGNVYFLKTFQFGYALSKNFVSGIGNNVTNNPFIINTMLQTRVLKNKGTLQIRAFDLLNQNNFLNRTTTSTGFTDTKTNTQSRYFMVNLSLNLQKWSGASRNNGQQIRRRGDGSFIN